MGEIMATTMDELITRRFTGALNDPAYAGKTVYDLFEWSKRDVHLTDYKTGRVLCDMQDLEFPSSYSQNAVDIIASKYFRRAGVPVTGHEVSMRQVAHRMVDFWVAALVDEGMVKEGEQAQIVYDELVYMILDQRFAPNSPQWFNTGLKRAYGIAGESQGMYYVDEDSGEVVESLDNYSRTQASACFILSIQDKLLGEHSISEEYVTETKLFRGGSGTGSNFSALRGEGERLSGGGVSSGVMNVITLTKNMLIGLIVMIYLLNIKESLSAQGKKFIYSVLPLKAANIVVAEFQFIKKAFSGFIIGKLIDSLIIGILCFILMHLFKLPYELLISVIIGVTNVIPFFGPFIGAAPCAILVFLISPKQCLYFIGLILVLQQFDGNILGPKILGNSTGVSSFGVLFSILLFGGLCGFVGMIIAVPLMAVIIHIYNQIQEYLLSKKSLSIKEEDYVNLKRIDEQNGEYKKHGDEQ